MPPKRSRFGETVLSFASQLGVADAGGSESLNKWGDEELRGISIETADALKIPPAKAARLVSRINSLKEEESDQRRLNRELWKLARQGYETHRGLLWTHKVSLLPEVDRVLREGADVNSVDAAGETALHGACANENKDVIAGLLQWGADCSIRSKHGKTASMKDMRALHAVAGKGPMEVIEALLTSDLDVNEQDELGQTAMHLAAKAGREEVLKALIEKGAALNLHDKRGRTPVHWAASEGHCKCTELLIAHGADVNAKTQAGTTALHWVAVKGCTTTATLLIKAGAEINARNNDGYTPYDRATDAKMKAILQGEGGKPTLGWWDLH